MALRAFTNKFNRGEVDRKAIGRQEVDRIKNSAAYVNNWLPIRLGPMMVRPGLRYLEQLLGVSYNVPFVRATDDLAIINFTNQLIKVLVDDAFVERIATPDTITNGDFTASIASWTDTSDVGGTAAHVTVDAVGYASLYGDGVNEGAISQTTVPTTFTERGIRIVIKDAPCTVSIIGDSTSFEYFSGVLLPGTHSLAVTPDATQTNLTIRLSNAAKYRTLIDSVSFEAAGDMTLPCDIPTADFQYIRYDQSVDVMFVTCKGYAPLRIERRGMRSWSVVLYRCDDGPFETVNASSISLTAGALSGNTTLTASKSLFKTTHVGALFKHISATQTRTVAASAENIFTSSIRVTGIDSARTFTIAVTGTFVATVTLQQSPDNATWSDIESYTVVTNKTYTDVFDNAILYYRLIVKTGNYTSGTANLSLSYASGSIVGIARVTHYTSPTVVDVQIIEDFGSLDASRDWFEGSWSAKRGFPSATTLAEGRLCYAGKNRVWASVSDVFDSFSRDSEGNDASIMRTIGFGPADNVDWMRQTTAILLGIMSAEITVRSSQFNEILTPSNANLRSSSTHGTAAIDSVKSDDSLYYVQRSKRKLFAIDYTFDSDGYKSRDLNVLNPGICTSNIVRIAVTREPETRVYAVLADGTMRVYMIDPTEDVTAWSRITPAAGTVTDVMVLPGEVEDRIYVTVLHNGQYSLQKFALQSDSIGGSANDTFDIHTRYTSPGTSLTGLTHADGTSVGVWADGADRGDFVVTGGTVTVPSSWTDVTVGLRYNADYLSNRLIDYTDRTFVFNENKRVDHIGLVLQDTWSGALQYGPDVAHLDPLELYADGVLLQNVMVSDNEDLPVPFNGEFKTDSRFYLRASGPCTVLELMMQIDDPNEE